MVQRKCLQLCSKEIVIGLHNKRRTHTDCVETYKFVQNIWNKYKTSAKVYFRKPTRKLGGHFQKLMKQYSRKEIRKNFFSNQVKTWNTLRGTTVTGTRQFIDKTTHRHGFWRQFIDTIEDNSSALFEDNSSTHYYVEIIHKLIKWRQCFGNKKIYYHVYDQNNEFRIY